MTTSKLLDIIRVIPNDAHQKVKDFLASPYFNKKEILLDLFCAFYVASKSKSGFAEPNSDLVWKQIYPNTPFDKKAMTYLMSELVEKLELFLGQQAIEQAPFLLQRYKLLALSEYNLPKHFKKIRGRIDKQTETLSLRNANYYFHKYEVAQADNKLFTGQRIRKQNPFPQDQNDALDQFYIRKKLELFCIMLNQKNILGIDCDLSWPSSLDGVSNRPGFDAVLETYLHLFNLLKNQENSTDDIHTYLRLLSDSRTMIEEVDLRDLYSAAFNFCMLEINKGKRSFAPVSLDICQQGIENGGLLLDDTLSPWIFKNAIKIGLGLKRFSWVEEFIRAYSSKLPEGHRQDALHFSLADSYYYQKQYDKAQEHLNKVEFTDLSYKHGAKVMLLKIYFERDDTSAFLSLVSSYKILLLREKGLTQDLLANYKNFVRFTHRLYMLKNGKSDALGRLKEKVMQTRRLSSKNWLLQQVEKHEKG